MGQGDPRRPASERRAGQGGPGQGGDVGDGRGDTGDDDDCHGGTGPHRRTGNQWGEEQTDEDDGGSDEDRGSQLAVDDDRTWPRAREHGVGMRRRRRKKQTSGEMHYFRLASGTTNSSEWGLALPFLPCGQLLRLKSTQGVPSFSSRKLRSMLSLPPGPTLSMHSLWLPSTPVRATK